MAHILGDLALIVTAFGFAIGIPFGAIMGVMAICQSGGR